MVLLNGNNPYQGLSFNYQINSTLSKQRTSALMLNLVKQLEHYISHLLFF